MGFTMKSNETKPALYSLSTLNFLHNNNKCSVSAMFALDKNGHKTNVFASEVLEVWFYKNMEYEIPNGYTSMDLFAVGGGEAGGRLQALSSSDPNVGGGNNGSTNGGNGGETKTIKKIDIRNIKKISINIGSGGSSYVNFVNTDTRFDYTRKWQPLLYSNIGGDSFVKNVDNDEELIRAKGGDYNKNTGSAGGYPNNNVSRVGKSNGESNFKSITVQQGWSYRTYNYGTKGQERSTKLFEDEYATDLFSGGGGANANGGDGGGGGPNNNISPVALNKYECYESSYNAKVTNVGTIYNGIPYSGGGGFSPNITFDWSSYYSTSDAYRCTYNSSSGGCGIIIARFYATNRRSQKDKIKRVAVGLNTDEMYIKLSDKATITLPLLGLTLQPIDWDDGWRSKTNAQNNFPYSKEGEQIHKIKANFSDCTQIQNNFMYNVPNLKEIDFSSLKNVTIIGQNFLRESINISNESIINSINKLTKLVTIQHNFIYANTEIININFNSINTITTIQNNFMYGCTKLEKCDMHTLTNLTSIGSNFLRGCKSYIELWVPLTPNPPSLGSNGFDTGEGCIIHCGAYLENYKANSSWNKYKTYMTE